MVDRDKLFKSFGFVPVGGVVEGSFDEVCASNNYNIGSTIYVDFSKKRVMIDSGDFNEIIFLKGKMLESEKKIFKKYEEDLIFKIDEMSGLNAIRMREEGNNE